MRVTMRPIFCTLRGDLHPQQFYFLLAIVDDRNVLQHYIPNADAAGTFIEEDLFVWGDTQLETPGCRWKCQEKR